MFLLDGDPVIAAAAVPVGNSEDEDSHDSEGELKTDFIQIFVTYEDKQKCVTLQRHISKEAAKRKICKKLEITDSQNLKIMIKQHHIEGQGTIGSIGIKSGSTIAITERQKGGGGKMTSKAICLIE